MRTLCSFTLVCLVLSTPLEVEARVWTDATGQYTIEAELVAYDDDQVILQRNADSELGAVDVNKLSAEDRGYLATKEAKDRSSK